MEQWYGYAGRILYVNLTNFKIESTELDSKIIKNFIGARGLGAKILWDRLRLGVDPFSPENPFIISTGPLAGTGVQMASRWFATFKSPLTGTYFRSVGGGYFGAELKFAGFDALVIEGRSSKPVYLWIQDGKVEIRDASHVWGLMTDSSINILREETDKKAAVITIGPAGEKLVRFASIQTDDQRSAARGGGGAVLGSKNLKAIVVKGSGKPRVFNSEMFKDVLKEQLENIKNNPAYERFHLYGTNSVVYLYYTLGHFPTFNFKQLPLENVDRFRIETLREYILGHHGCYACILQCGKNYKLTKGPFAGVYWQFPEYETLWAFGGNLGITNIEAIAYANMLCDKYGLDTISTGVVISFAYELYEKGILTRRETDGLELRWGDPDAMVELIRKIALREGIGNILAEGTKRASSIIGRGAERFAMHIKGLELPAYDPRSAKAHGLSMVTSNIGASHTVGWSRPEIAGIPWRADPFSLEMKGELAKTLQDEIAMYESAGICLFAVNRGMITPSLLSRLLYAVTGIPEFQDVDYLQSVGERVWNLERAINIREGFDKKDDTAPERILNEPVPREPSKGQIFELDKLLRDYYSARGWDVDSGLPTREKLESLGLTEVVSELQRLGKLK